MSTAFREIIERCLPKSTKTPHVCLKCSKAGIQLYTNYACVTGLSALECATQFNQETAQRQLDITTTIQGNFIYFLPGQSYLQARMEEIAQHCTPCPSALPDENPTAYLCYTLSVIQNEYPILPGSVPYTKQAQDLATLLLYMVEHPIQQQKRQREFTARLTAFQNTLTYTKLHASEKTLLTAACVMLLPHRAEESAEGHPQ